MIVCPNKKIQKCKNVNDSFYLCKLFARFKIKINFIFRAYNNKKHVNGSHRVEIYNY